MAPRETLKKPRARLLLTPKIERVRLNTKSTREKLVMRERISLSQIARITGLDPSTIDLWRRDIPGYWKGLAPCPTSPPIRDAYADLERVEFYLDELLIWLDTSRNYRRRLWFENLLNASRSDPEFFEKMEAERRENRRLFRRNRGLVAKMPDSLPYADWKTYDIRRYH